MHRMKAKMPLSLLPGSRYEYTYCGTSANASRNCEYVHNISIGLNSAVKRHAATRQGTTMTQRFTVSLCASYVGFHFQNRTNVIPVARMYVILKAIRYDR